MQRIASIAIWCPAAGGLIAVIVALALSLNLPIKADLAMLHYCAWLINERDFVLYRDIFELNLPGPFLFHSLLGKTVGYEALPMRLVDITLLAVLGWMSWRIVSPLSRAAAIFGYSLFVLLYLFNGGDYVLERDYLGLLPAVAAFAIASRPTLSRQHIIFCGIFCGAACSMKPNFVVVFPALWWMCKRFDNSSHWRTILLLLSSTIVTAAVPMVWMMQQGGMRSFIDIYHQFVPIYASSRGDLWHYDSVDERVTFVLRNYLIYGGIAGLLSAAGLARAWCVYRHQPAAQQQIRQLAAIAASMTLYEVIAGKFWFNHMFPSAYWTALCFGLLLTPSPAVHHPLRTVLKTAGLAIPAAALASLVGLASMQSMISAHQREQQTPLAWRAREVAEYLLSQQLEKQEKVQVLDFAGDGQAALLMARATSATRHLIDVPLYMQPDEESTQALREELVTALQQQPPAFIVYFEQFFHPGGGNRLKEFRELYALLDSQYLLTEQREGQYSIYRRKDRPTH